MRKRKVVSALFTGGAAIMTGLGGPQATAANEALHITLGGKYTTRIGSIRFSRHGSVLNDSVVTSKNFSIVSCDYPGAPNASGMLFKSPVGSPAQIGTVSKANWPESTAVGSPFVACRAAANLSQSELLTARLVNGPWRVYAGSKTSCGASHSTSHCYQAAVKDITISVTGLRDSCKAVVAGSIPLSKAVIADDPALNDAYLYAANYSTLEVTSTNGKCAVPMLNQVGPLPGQTFEIQPFEPRQSVTTG